MFIAATAVFILIKTVFSKFKGIRRKTARYFKNARVHKGISVLYGKRESAKEEEKYIEAKIDLVLTVLIIGSILAYLAGLGEKINPVLTNENEISRPEYGKGSKTVDLYVIPDEDSSQKLSVSVSDMVYSREEINKMAEEVKNIISEDMTGDNQSADMVRSSLNLMTSVEGYPFNITWKSEKPLLLKSSGKIDEDRLKKILKETNEESVVVKIYAELSYEDYTENMEMAVRLYPPLTDSKSRLKEKIVDTIKSRDEETRENEKLVLPEDVDGVSISYTNKNTITDLLVFILTVILAAGVYAGRDNDLCKKVLERNEQMESDYPRIVNRYALYYCAGMHPKQIWKEICRNYRQSLSIGGERRYAFEEMLKCEALMNDGVGELAAMSEFASECGLKKYRSFVNLIEQALTKGKEEMSEALKTEAEDAANEKLMRAKIKGEKAGTKLLLPMFMMLLVVLIIVIVPAFINFKV